jgi:mannosyltransferase
MTIKEKLRPLANEWPLAIVLLIGLLMRIRGLTHQSLWLDELHTMNEADPSISWNELFRYLKCCDQHPPLYFITERIAFTLFGHTEFVARIISVIAGTFSILAVYWLGKELLNKSLGLIAAILTCVNFYNLAYSQEARCYIFAFLFAALSFLYFIRLIKNPVRKNALVYGLLTLALLYSHYYSLFTVAAQAVLGLLFIFREQGQARAKLFRLFAVSAVIIAAGYAPWLSFLKAIAGIKSFWIGTTDHSFLQNYFSEYFGNAELLKPVLVALLLAYVISIAIRNRNEFLSLQQDRLTFSFLVLAGWVFITLLIPYIRSVTSFPMLFPRYTIVVLPAILVAIAYGIELFNRPILKYAITTLVVVLSLVHLLGVRKYYTAVSKTQFREMSRFITENNAAAYPVINEITSWHQRYYLNKYGSKAEILAGRKESLIDSVLSGSSAKYKLQGFWIAGTSGDKKPGDSVLKRLDTAWIRVKEKDFFDAWAMLYVSKDVAAKEFISIPFDRFPDGPVLPGTGTVAIWNGAIHSSPVLLPQGNYNIIIQARGDAAGGQYPHLNIYINDKKTGDYYVTGAMEHRRFAFAHPRTDSVRITVEMDNDFTQPGQGDRNAFVSNIFFEPVK